MPKAYADDIRNIAAENPSAIVLGGIGKSVALIPACNSVSDYAGSRITDRESIRSLLNSARSDNSIVARVRRMHAGLVHGANANLRSDGKIFDAIAEAVSRGQIYAVMADNKPRNVPDAQPVAVNLNYAAFAGRFLALASPPTDFFGFLGQELPGLWCQVYSQMPDGDGEIVQVNDEGYNFLFDTDAERVVVAFGTSHYNPAKRDSERMAGFLGKVASVGDLKGIAAAAPNAAVGEQRQAMAQLTWRDRFFKTYGHKYDRGHFMSHRQGGGLDINLFPQRADINQGHGVLGAGYRTMERTCVDDSVFCFSRPIYDDGTWVPAQLEYGVVHAPQRMSVRTFPNK